MTAPRAVILTANEFEDMELFFPYFRLIEEGVAVDVAAPESGNHPWRAWLQAEGRQDSSPRSIPTSMTCCWFRAAIPTARLPPCAR